MNTVPALQRGLEIIREVSKNKYNLNELEKEMEIPKASFNRLIKCLIENKFINYENETKNLSAGDDLIFLAMESYENSSVYQQGYPSVRKLSERWNVSFVIHEYVEDFCIYWRVKSVPPDGISTRPPGFYMQGMNTNAQGQLFLSQMADTEIKRFCDSSMLTFHSEYTLKTYEEIIARVNEIRKQGYAYLERENNAFMKQIAVPLKLKGNGGIFSLTCYLPLDFEDVTPLRENMLFEAARISGIE
jgi:DNA-binding IclR family transcriptional regulator